MLTSTITTPHFRDNVHNLVASYYATVDNAENPDEFPVPLVPALKPIDSTLTPNDIISQLIITAASWIDLASPDPIIANVSQQVFNLEVAYAAFCGVQHIVVQAPTLGNHSRLTQFSRAIQGALSIGSYIQFHILLPIAGSDAKSVQESKHLSRFAKTDEANETGGHISDWTSWDAWNAIRQFCNYSGRLSVGKKFNHNIFPTFPVRV